MVLLKVLPKNIIWMLRKINPPKVLMDERMLLEKLGIQCTHIKLMNIRRGKNGNSYSCYWRFYIRQQSIIDYPKKIGFILGTKKQKKFEKEIKLFIKFRGVPLTDRDLERYDLPKG